MYKDDILNRMKLLDQHAGLEFDDGGRFHVIIVGGTVNFCNRQSLSRFQSLL